MGVFAVFAVLVVGSIIVKQLAKEGARIAYDKILAVNSIAYKEIEVSQSSSTGNEYTNDIPSFSVTFPVGFQVKEVFNNTTVIVKDIVSPRTKTKLQIRVIDTYSLSNDQSYSRDKFAFNVFMDTTMKAWFVIDFFNF